MDTYYHYLFKTELQLSGAEIRVLSVEKHPKVYFMASIGKRSFLLRNEDRPRGKVIHITLKDILLTLDQVFHFPPMLNEENRIFIQSNE